MNKTVRTYYELYNKCYKSKNLNGSLKVRLNHNFQHNAERIPTHKNNEESSEIVYKLECLYN